MRVCLLTKSEPYAWTRHYVQAFRALGAEVITVGPAISREHLEGMHLGHLADRVVPNDIDAELESGFPLQQVLPQGWRPDLIVAVSIGGEALCPAFDGLRCPRVYVSVDTWQSPRDYLDALHYDYVFAAQREAVPRLRAFGARRVTWLPLGCNPAEHFATKQAAVADLSFVGSIALPIHQDRYDLLQRLQQEFTVFARSGLYGEGLCEAVCAGKLTFNHSAVHDLNMRVFEAMAMGCPLVTNRAAERNGLLDLFEDGKHLIAYDGADDLVEKVRYYLDHDTERQAMAGRAQTLALDDHTYLNRAHTIVETVFGGIDAPVPQPEPANPIPERPYFPYAPQRVLDVGMQFRDCVDTLPLADKSELWGVGESSTPGYESVVTESKAVGHTAMFDVLCATGIPHPWWHTSLAPGGTLILRLPVADAEQAGVALDATALSTWLAGRGYNMLTGAILANPDGTSEACLLAARKRERPLNDLVNETFAPLPATCQFVKDWIEGWIKTLPKGM